jgi:hypothetical protein
MYQIEQSRLMHIVAVNQTEIAKLQRQSARESMAYHDHAAQTIWNGVKGEEFYDGYIQRTRELLRKDIVLLIRALQYEYKTTLIDNNPLIAGCNRARSITSIGADFRECFSTLQRAKQEILSARGTPRIDPNDADDRRYNQEIKIVTFSGTETPVAWDSFKESGVLIFDLNVSENGTERFSIPFRNRVAEVITTDVWYESENQEVCQDSHLLENIRWRIKKGPLESIISLDSPDFIYYAAGGYYSSAVTSGTVSSGLPRQGGSYSSSNFDYARTYFREHNALRFDGRALASSWLIEFIQPNLKVECIKSLRAVFLYRYLLARE